MTNLRSSRFAILTLVVIAGIALAMAGPATADEGDGFDVDVDFPEDFAADDNQTIGVEVENTDNEDELVSPLIEVSIRSDFDINESSETEVVVQTEDGPETRNADITDSSFRSGDSLEIEGVGVPAGETYTYEVNIDVASPGETDVQVDVRPLNDESNNDRDTYTTDALGFGEITVNSDTDVNVTGDDTDISDTGSFSADVLQSLDTDRSYTVDAQIDLMDNLLEIEDVAPEESNTESVWFSDASTADDPTIIGHTEPNAEILSPSTQTVRGNAETETVVKNSYTLETDGGQTYLIIEDTDVFDSWTGDVSFETDDGDSTEIEDADDITVIEIDVDDDTDGSFEFEGFRVGDVNEDGEVTSSDATTIANAVVDDEASNLDSLTSDVTDNGDISVVDAMFIEQYVEENRDADYDLAGGS